MDENAAAGARLQSIVGGRICEIESTVPASVAQHATNRHIEEAFGRLTIAGLDLRSDQSRPIADRVGVEEFKGVALAHPYFERRFRLEDADQQWQAGGKAACSQTTVDFRQVGSARQRQPAHAGHQPVLFLAETDVLRPDLDRLRRQTAQHKAAEQGDGSGEPEKLVRWRHVVAPDRYAATADRPACLWPDSDQFDVTPGTTRALRRAPIQVDR